MIKPYDYLAAAAAKSLQSCPTLCDPRDGSPPGSHPWDSPGKNDGACCHFLFQWRKVKSESEVTQSCPNLCDRMDCSLPSSSVHGIFQARVLEWGAIAFSETYRIYTDNSSNVLTMKFPTNKIKEIISMPFSPATSTKI